MISLSDRVKCYFRENLNVDNKPATYNHNSPTEDQGMKKITVTVIVILGIAILFIPFVNGIIMEKIVRQSQSDVNQLYSDTGSDVTLEIIDYKRNFRSSDIVWKVNFGSLKTFYGVDEILLTDHAVHGYTGIVSTTNLEKNPWFRSFIDNKLNGNNPLTITTRYRLNGTIETEILVGEFTIENKGKTVEVHPGQITVECSPGFDEIASEAEWDGLAIDEVVNVDRAEMNYDLKKISTYIWEGSLEYELAGINGRAEDRKFEFSGLKGDYSLDYTEKEQTLSTEMSARFDALAGPEINIRDASASFALNRIDAQGYEDFMKLYTETVNSTLKDIADAQDDPEKMKTLMEQRMGGVGLQMLGIYERLLKKGLELKLSDIKATLPEGTVEGELSLILNQDITFAQMGPITQKHDLAFSLFSLDSKLNFPAELVQDSPMLTAPLLPGMKTGIFVQDGSMLRHHARTEDGTLVLNGNKVTFD